MTFLHSESAFNVLVASHNGSFISERLLSVMPADTAQQSETFELEQMDTDEGSDDAAEITQVTHGLKELSLNPAIPCDSHDQLFEINLGLGLNLKQIRKLIFQIEPFQNHLVLDYDCIVSDEEKDSDDDEDTLWNIDKTDFEQRATETIARMCTKKFKKLTIRGKAEISIEMLQWLQPLLNVLHFLNICTFANARILYALQAYCPKLKKLQFHACKWRGTDAISGFVSKPCCWPSLTALTLKFVDLNIGSDTENGVKFQHFIELNPQLEVLELAPVVDNAMLMKIAKDLPNLRSLVITRRDCSNPGSVINSISGLKQLASIQLTTLIAQDLQPISSFVQQFSVLELVVLVQNYEPSIGVEEQFEQLADFSMTHHNGCNCNDTERILSFGDYLDDVAVPKEQPVIVLITNTKVANSSDGTSETGVIDMLNDSKKFYPNVIKQKTVQGKDHQTFIHISSA